VSNRQNSKGIVSLLVGDGLPLLTLSGLALFGSGSFALFLSARREFLPHDVAYLGITPQQLCAVNECRIVHFMIHDRVAFGGALIAIGLVYLWLAAEPLRQGFRWAWLLFIASAVEGFLSFLAYIGYGYLDFWHASATLILLPLMLAGLAMTRNKRVPSPCRIRWPLTCRENVGRWLLLGTSTGMIGGGLTILTVGMTTVFVPEDTAFLGMTASELHAIHPRLIPLIAHDRAGFGGAVCCCGILLAGIALFAEMTRAAIQTLALAGLAGFGTAIFVHPAIGYTDWWHLTPAIGGAALFLAGLVLVQPKNRDCNGHLHSDIRA
jgi:hypothetical protein